MQQMLPPAADCAGCRLLRSYACQSMLPRYAPRTEGYTGSPGNTSSAAAQASHEQFRKGCLAARERKVKAVAPLGSGKYKHPIKPPDGSEAADKMFRSHDLTAESPHPKAGSLKSKTVKRAAPPPEVPEYKEYGNRTKKAKYDYKAHHHKIFEMLIAGYSYRAIAARVGIPAQHIWKYCTKYLKNKEDKNV